MDLRQPNLSGPDRTVRRVTLADLGDVCALLAASDTAVLGHLDFTPADVEADLCRDDLEAYGWYAGGGLAGYGWVSREADSNQVEVDLYVHPQHDARLGHDVLSHLESRGAVLAAEAGHDAARLSTGAYRADERARDWLRSGGFAIDTTFTRMRIDLDPAGSPAVRGNDRIAIRPVGLDDVDGLRTAHRISQEAFADHWGHVDQPYATWLARLLERGEDYATVYLADLADLDGALGSEPVDLGGEPVGVLIGTRQFESDQDAGYVRVLGVLAAGRGAGVATTMLRDYFARSRAAGRVAVLLHVDVANVTGALRL